jgi:hypothetical protein
MASQAQLQEAYQLIRQGQQVEAVRLLVPLVRADPNDADAWWLMANAVSDPAQQRRALEQVLRLRPNDDKARKMLARLDAAQNDPFADPAADPFASAPPTRSTPTARRMPADDPFGDPVGFSQPKRGFDQPTSPYPPGQGQRVVVRERARRSGCVTCLGIFGVLALVLCGVCTFATLALPSAIRPIVDSAIASVNAQDPALGGQLQSAANALFAGDQAAFENAVNNISNQLSEGALATAAALNPQIQNAVGTVQAGGVISPELQSTLNAVTSNFSIEVGGVTFGPGGAGDVRDQGTIEIGQTVRGTIAGSERFGYRLSLNAGDQVIFVATPSRDTDDFDLVLVDAATGTMLASSSAGFSGEVEELEYNAPANTIVQIRVYEFGGEGGTFDLSVGRRR